MIRIGEKNYDIRFELLLALIFFSCISYLPWFLECIMTGRKITYSYTMNMEASNAFAKNFVLIKDIICGVLLILYSNRKRIIAFYLFCIIMILPLCISNYNNSIMLSLIAGVRSLMFLVVLYEGCSALLDSCKVRISKLIEFIIILEFVVVMIQFFMSGIPVSSIGNTTNRFMGLFPASGNLGYFTISAAFFVGYKYRIEKSISNIHFAVLSCLIIFMAIAAGSRGAVVQGGLIIFGALFDAEHLQIKERIIFAGTSIVIVVLSIMNFMIERAGRGEIFQSGSGRVEALTSIFVNSNFLELLIGHGIGQGTTALVQFGQSNIVVDTTLATFIYEFGVIVAFILFVVFFKLIVSIIRQYANSIFVISSALSITIVVLTGIPTDQFGFLAIALPVYYLLKEPRDEIIY